VTEILPLQVAGGKWPQRRRRADRPRATFSQDLCRTLV